MIYEKKLKFDFILDRMKKIYKIILKIQQQNIFKIYKSL
jgi:hypothetical protein